MGRPRLWVPRKWASRARLSGPSPTIRLRLTVLYGVVFLITGAVLLTIGYLLVRSNLEGRHALRVQVLRELGVAAPPAGQLSGFRPGSEFAQIAHAVQSQVTSDALHRLIVEYLFALGVMTMIAVGTGWLLAGRVLRPLRDITATARRVSGKNLGERIALTGPADELKELADTFDGMLGRLDAAFASQRHFVANASHELRTPLAIMRTEVDVALADPDATRTELRTMGEAVRETIDRTERLIESLLVLARSEAATGREEPVDLAALAADCVTDLHARAEENHVTIKAELEPAWTRGEPGLLERMIANLIDNGIRHNEPGGHLEISARTSDGHVRLVVANGGTVIAPDDAEHLLEPFRRLDRTAGGVGLGLSIVRSVVHAHHGTIDVIAPHTGGLELRITLPRSQPYNSNVVLVSTSASLTPS
ncbi:MAG TPA: HAMP domain-containing sensor histidine kinase [Solirubrobacteraceae bacterium]|jgi:signal transduction histidine kinase|nr:HAMP domain-containing sensor histidine kinase [Solirubrobacteraceae bacterium]